MGTQFNSDPGGYARVLLLIFPDSAFFLEKNSRPRFHTIKTNKVNP